MNISSRLYFSFFINVSRSLLGFFSSILIANALGPTLFGDYSYLLATFSSVFIFISCGASSYFFTTISKAVRSYYFYKLYFLFQLLLLLVCIFIGTALYYTNYRDVFFPVNEYKYILYAASAIFLQQLIWPTISQVSESDNKTFTVYSINIVFNLIYFLYIAYLNFYKNPISIDQVFVALIFQYLFTSIMSWNYLNKYKIYELNNNFESLNTIVSEYIVYCKPLIIMTMLSAAYTYFDRWIIQISNGSTEQALFQISNQISSISLLFANAILPYFWKELAGAFKLNDLLKVNLLFRKSFDSLLIVNSFIAGLIIPVCNILIVNLLSSSYFNASNILAILVFNVIYTTVGQLIGATLLAKSETRLHLYFSIATIFTSLPLTIVLVGPSNLGFLDMGGLGVSIKLVTMTILSCSFELYILDKLFKIKINWFVFVSTPIIFLIFGFVSFNVVNIMSFFNFLNMDVNSILHLFLYLFIYIILSFWFVHNYSHKFSLPTLLIFKKK